MLVTSSQITALHFRRRRGLAPVELVLWLPVLLMVMALIVNYANMTSWRLRGEVVSRDAVWRARWPRSGSVEPRPPATIWPEGAAMGVRRDIPVWQLNHPNIAHPVVRGPILETGIPPRQFRVRPVLDEAVGAVAGTSNITRPYDLLSTLGRYDSGEIANPLLTRTWQNAQMGFSNNYRRTLVLYDLPQTSSGLPAAYVRSIVDLLRIPHFRALAVLDRDQDWWLYHGSYPNFYPRIAPSYGETDPAVVYERSVKPNVDHFDEHGNVVFGRISLLPRHMTNAYLHTYRAAKQEIEDIENALRSVPGPTPEQRLALRQRLARLRRIQDLDRKIAQLEADLRELHAREERMRSYFKAMSGGSGGESSDESDAPADSGT